LQAQVKTKKKTEEAERQEETLHITGGLAQLGGKVIARIVVCLLTVGDSPNCVLLNPQLRQAAGALGVSSGRQHSGK
jgi:hypothetical protein